MTRSKGFTLIELMVTISIAAILMAIAVPSFQNISANNALKSTTRDLVSSINTARSQSISTRTDVIVEPTGQSWDGGWSLNYANAAAEESTDFQPQAGVQVARTDSNDGLIFMSRGGLRGGPATFTVCHSDLDRGRSISVSFLGKVATEMRDC